MVQFTVTYGSNGFLISYSSGKKISYPATVSITLDTPYVVMGTTFLDHRDCTNPVSASDLELFDNIRALWVPPETTTSVTFPATQDVHVTNSPTVSVSNLPVTQPVSGSVSVSNFPATQPVSGTFWQATQPVSGTVAISSIPTASSEITSPLGPFGGVNTTHAQPVYQEYFVYNFVNPFRWLQYAFGSGASITASENLAVLTQGTSSTGLVSLLGKKSTHYRPGSGTMIRMTIVYDTGIADCVQMAGLWNNNSGVGFGYNGTSFGTFLRNGGYPEIRVLTITVGASGSGSVTITLNGVAFGPISVIAGSTGFTAHQLQSFAYTGWSCLHIGNDLHFRNLLDGPRSGSYSISSTVGVTGTFATEKAGVTATTTWTPQASWNQSTASWLTPQLGNIYEITYQWLGFGEIVYKILNPSTGVIANVHKIEYPNTSASLSMIQPNLPCQAAIISSGATTAKTMRVGCFSTFIYGDTVLNGVNLRSFSRNAVSYLTASGETVIFSIRNRPSLNGYVNQSNLIFQSLNLAASGNNQVRFTIYLNSTLGNNTSGNFDSWTYIDSTNSLALYDTTATTQSGGIAVFTTLCGQTESKQIDLRSLNLECHRDDSFTITAFSNNNSTISVSINWYDDF